MTDDTLHDNSSPDITIVAWRTSSCSANGGGQCLAAGTNQHVVAIRDTKDDSSASLTISRRDWASFLGNVNAFSTDSVAP